LVLRRRESRDIARKIEAGGIGKKVLKIKTISKQPLLITALYCPLDVNADVAISNSVSKQYTSSTAK
jgi:hypothetical protein